MTTPAGERDGELMDTDDSCSPHSTGGHGQGNSKSRPPEAICDVCESSHGSFLCPDCCNSVMNQKRRYLEQLNEKRNALKLHLESLLKAREEEEQQQFELEERRLSLRSLEKQRAEMHLKLNKAKQELETRRAALADRAEELSRASAKLALLHHQKIDNELPDALRVHSLNYRYLSGDLAQKQRQQMRKLRSILPLRLCQGSSGAGAGAGGAMPQPRHISICNIKIPVGDDCSDVPAGELAAGLGYLLHFASLSAKYLGSPTLHQSGFKASASTIWQAQSFWDPRPTPIPGAECPLYLSRAELEASEGCKPSTPADVEAEDAALAGGSASDVVVAGLAGKDLPRGTRRGLALLKRSVGVMVARELELFKSPPPPGWGPLATFTAVCSALSRDAAAAAKQPHPATAAASSSHAASRVAGGAGPSQSRHQEHTPSAAGSGGSHMATSVAGSSVFGQLGNWMHKRGHALALGASVWGVKALQGGSSLAGGGQGAAETGQGHSGDQLVLGSDGDYVDEFADGESDDEIDGWDIVDLPSLPPPPSRSEDVEHWARAMIVDAS